MKKLLIPIILLLGFVLTDDSDPSEHRKPSGGLLHGEARVTHIVTDCGEIGIFSQDMRGWVRGRDGCWDRGTFEYIDVNLWCIDCDGDGFGFPASPVCLNPGEDCAQFNPNINPGAQEIEDGVDNNCDGQVDELSSNPTCFIEGVKQ